MRIWIIHQHAISPINTGPTRHYDLARKLIEHGHEVFILAGNYSHIDFKFIEQPFTKTKKLSIYNNVPFLWINTPQYKGNSLGRLWNMAMFAKHLLATNTAQVLPKPDVIIGSSPSPFAAFAAQKLSKRFNVPFVYEIRDLWPETLLELGHFSKYHPLIVGLARIEHYLLKNSNLIISVLPGLKDYVLKKGFLEKKILWLPNFVDLNSIPYSKAQDNEVINVMYAGAFNVGNDLRTLLHAAKILEQSSQPSLRVKLIGEGNEKSALQKLANELQLNRVEFLNPVPKQQIYPILMAADIFVGMLKKSNLYRYGTSLNKISDYLACGRPTIFAVNSPYDPISFANAGMIVEPEQPELLANAIQKIASLSLEERNRMGINGRQYIQQNFSLETIIPALETALNHIV